MIGNHSLAKLGTISDIRVMGMLVRLNGLVTLHCNIIYRSQTPSHLKGLAFTVSHETQDALRARIFRVRIRLEVP